MEKHNCMLAHCMHTTFEWSATSDDNFTPPPCLFDTWFAIYIFCTEALLFKGDK